MGIKFLSYVPAIIGVLSIALFVYLNNPKDEKNRAFALVNLLAALWLASLFITDITTSEVVALWSLRAALFFGSFVFLSLIYFVLVFPYKTKIKPNLKAVLFLPAVIIAFLSLTPAVVNSVTIQDFGAQPQNVGLLYTLTDILSFMYALGAVAILTTKLVKSNDIKAKNQIKLVLYGLLIAIITNAVTGLVITILQIETDFILFGGFSLFIFSLFVAYAIVKHGFLDIRPIIARTVAYLLVLATVVGLFAGTLFGLSALFLDENAVTNEFQIGYLIIALLVALLIQPLKKFFDRVTNRIFYRDAYDPQELLNNLNRSLATTIDLEKLLSSSGKIISETLKSEYCGFIIREADKHDLRIVGAKPLDHHTETNKKFLDLVAHSHSQEKIVLLDVLGPSRKTLADSMRSLNLAMMIKLQGHTQAHNQRPGFMLLGQKKSGAQYSSEDIRVLEIIADELVIAIQNALRFEEIQQFNITLRKKIDDATRELRRVNARLRELDKTKDEFISMASHQLRTPLTAVKGYLSMILEGDTGPVKKDQKEMIQRSYDGAQKMVYLIADMLNVSRLQTGKFVIENKPTNLPDVVEGEINQLREEIAQKKITLNFKKPSGYPTLNLDETKMRQVIMNFLDNALYYTPSGGEIEIKLETTPETASYSVTDTGVGVPKDVQHHLFSKFYRADNARKMRPDGTGLGLYMAKKVVTAQGGAIIFRSEEGKGSTFGFSFPRASTEVKAK